MTSIGVVNFICLHRYTLESAFGTYLVILYQVLLDLESDFSKTICGGGKCNTTDSVVSLFSTSAYQYHVLIAFIADEVRLLNT